MGDEETLTPHGPATNLLPAGRVGRYVIIDKLGEGGMGVVYSAYDAELDRAVAIKLMRGSDPGDHARLVREARTLAKLQHPNVVAVHDAHTVGDAVYVAMELVSGADLRVWRDQRPRGLAEILDVFIQAGRGLAAAHAAGIVHRDFKPANVLVGADSRIRVADFGLALTFAAEDGGARPSSGDVDSSVTRPGDLVGTPAYMSPEQLRRRPATAASDQFSFCASLYEAVCAERPFSVEALAKGELPTPGYPGVPGWLRAVLQRGLAADPAARYPSMDALLADLRRDRVTRRRRVAGATVAVLGAAAIVVGAVRRAPACAGAGDKVAGVWNEGKKSAMHVAFAATGLPFAEDTFGRVAQRLDAYASDWAAMRQDACEATAVRHEQSAALLDLRMDCLDRRLGKLTSLVAVLAGPPEAVVVTRAVSAVTGLQPLAGCADRAALGSAVPPPTDTVVKIEVASLRVRIDQFRALLTLGRFRDLMPLASTLAAESRLIPYAPVQSDALDMLMIAHMVAGDDQAAEATAWDALQAAARARDDAQIAGLLRNLMLTVGENRPAEALTLGPIADAAVTRAGNPPQLRARFLRDLGTTLRYRGDLAGAERALRSAIAVIDASPTGLDNELVGTLNQLGILLERQARYAEARVVLERAIDVQQKLFGPDHPLVAGLSLNIGNVASFEDNDAEARIRYERALAIFEGVEGANGPNVAVAATNLGDIAYREGRDDDARRLLDRALAIKEKLSGPEHPALIAPLSNLALLHLRAGDVAEARRVSRREVAIAEKARGPEHAEFAAALARLARITVAAGEPHDALPVAERAVSIGEKALGAGHPTLSDLLIIRAEARAALGRHREAADDDARALALRESVATGSLEVADTLTHLAQRYLALDRASEAVPLLERALRIRATRTGPADDMAETRFALARALWGTDRPRAVALADEARQAYASLGARGEGRRAEVERWLAARAATPR